MQGGGDNGRRMQIDFESAKPMLPLRPNSLAPSPSALHDGQNSPFSRGEMQHVSHTLQAESTVNLSKKLQDDMQELGQRIKHHEDNVKYLKTLSRKMDDEIFEMQVTLGKCHTTSFFSNENEDTIPVVTEEEILQNILKYEKSAAAFLCRMKSLPEDQTSNHPLTKDVLGIVATLGKIDDSNLSRLLSEYLGLETMLAVVCKTSEGVKALEAYNKDGSINISLGLHAFAASIMTPLDDRFLVICLENLRPYCGEFIADDPQRRLDLVKPKLHGETPHGFLGYAVNMVSIDYSNLYCITKAGNTLRDTLFYNLFSSLQVYRSREDMLKALPVITNGAISLDGGVIRSTGMFSLGHQRRDIDVKFPSGSSLILPENYFEIENQMKETKWKKNRTMEDLQREEELFQRAKYNFESKKQEFVDFLARSSSYGAQMGRISTPR